MPVKRVPKELDKVVCDIKTGLEEFGLDVSEQDIMRKIARKTKKRKKEFFEW